MANIGRREFLKTSAIGAVAVGAELLHPRTAEAASKVPQSMDELRRLYGEYAAMLWPNQELRTVPLPVCPELVSAEEDGNIYNRLAMIVDARDNVLRAAAEEARAYGESQGWGNVLTQEGEWFYPMLITGGDYKTTSETWAYAAQIVGVKDLSVYQKPLVAGQIWARLPQGVGSGEVTVAFAVNPHYVNDKTGGDQNVDPAVMVHGNQGAPVEVVWGLPSYTKTGVLGRLFTGDLIVQLQQEGSVGNQRPFTVIRLPVTGNQTEVMFELGSDIVAGPNHNPSLNRVTPAMGRAF